MSASQWTARPRPAPETKMTTTDVLCDRCRRPTYVLEVAGGFMRRGPFCRGCDELRSGCYCPVVLELA